MRSSHGTADPGSWSAPPGAAAVAWLEELGCRFTRENGGYRLARCGGASRKRLLQVGDRTVTRSRKPCAGLRGEPGAVLAHHRLTGSRRPRTVARDLRDPDGTDRSTQRPSCSPREAGASRRRRRAAALDEPPTIGETTRIALDAGAEARPRRAAVPPNGGAWPATCRATRSGTARTAPCCSTPTARSSRTRSVRGTGLKASSRVEAGRGVETEAAAGDMARRRGSQRTLEVAPYMLRRYRGAGIDPLGRSSHLPVLHYQNGGLVIDTRETTLDGLFACGEIAGGTHGRNRDGQQPPGASSSDDARGKPHTRRRGIEDMSTTTVSLEDAVLGRRPYVWALRTFRRTHATRWRRRSRETSVTGSGSWRRSTERPDRGRAEEPRVPGHGDRVYCRVGALPCIRQGSGR
jgi:hypothetical protein